MKFPIDDARQRVVDCRALDEQRPFEKVEIFSRDTRPRSSQSTRVSWLNRTEALLNRQYGRVAHWNAVMHRYIYVKLAGASGRSMAHLQT